MSQTHNKINSKQVRSPVYLITDYWILITPLILSGCMGVYEGGFECPPGRGLGCTSISEVNKVVDQYGSVTEISEPESKLNELGKPNSTSSIWFNPRFDQCEDSRASCPLKLIKPEVWNGKNSI